MSEKQRLEVDGRTLEGAVILSHRTTHLSDYVGTNEVVCPSLNSVTRPSVHCDQVSESSRFHVSRCVKSGVPRFKLNMHHLPARVHLFTSLPALTEGDGLVLRVCRCDVWEAPVQSCSLTFWKRPVSFLKMAAEQFDEGGCCCCCLLWQNQRSNTVSCLLGFYFGNASIHNYITVWNSEAQTCLMIDMVKIKKSTVCSALKILS